jgi:GNAT superfamily N-acetyltransferase
VRLTVRVADGADDRQRFSDLVIEYETTLPPDLRHTEVGLSPKAAIVAFIDETSCGCVGLFDLGDAAIMKRLYVRSTFRNRGVARALLETFLTVAREHEYKRIVLDTDRERMPAAYALYRALGFEDCAPYGPVEYATPTYMELRLE